MSVDILPCPFCGSPGELGMPNGRADTWSVACSNPGFYDEAGGCNVSPESGWNTLSTTSKEEAVRRWNTREERDE